ncbi:MAG: hypothetical protein DSZ05_00435 [Sulfurospirillum sp.]|nr:MAG: hypothetical protein DSZ05_00435 [Sulfurospirillum sp.]
MQARFDEKKALSSFFSPLLIYGTVILLLLLMVQPKLYLLKNGVVVTLSLFALWRYGWMVLNYTRALIYRFYYYPRLRKKALRLPESAKYPKHLYFMIPSYKEDFWVSVECFRSILSEIRSIPSQVTIVVATSESREDKVIREMFRAYEGTQRVKLIFQHQKGGKRIAMGHALRAIAREYHKAQFDDPNSVTIFMDGDSYLQKGLLAKLLPFFASEHRLGAVTTNEVAYINSKNRWYKAWFNLKFAQRHILFQAHSLSRKVMTLTGRLSAYRTDIVIKESFIRQVENDILIHPLHGKFRFLMGDDKSTWFHLLKNGWDMLYLPDLLCISLESRDGNFLELSRTLPYRWFGNTLRNNSRALKLGPSKTGWYIWYAILEQRLIMWTSLVGIFSALILSVTVSAWYLLFFILWVMMIRLFQLFVMAFFGHRVEWRMLPLMLYTQWVGALVKIRAFYNLADQSWSKNSDVQKNSSEAVHISHPLTRWMPKIAMVTAVIAFVLVLLMSHGVFRWSDSAFTLLIERFFATDSCQLNAAVISPKISVHHEKNILQIAPCSTDVAAQINRFLKESDPRKQAVIQLGAGVYKLYHTIKIERSNVLFKGRGKGKTILLSYLKKPARAVIHIYGKRGKRIGFLQKNIFRNQTEFYCQTEKEATKYLLLRQPNDTQFLKKIGSRRWAKRYPYLRQEIVRIVDHDLQKNKFYTARPMLTDFAAGKTEVLSLEMVQNVTLQDFTLRQINGTCNIASCKFDYTNGAPDVMLDEILLEYAASCHIENVELLDSGSHPLHTEYVYGSLFTYLSIDGSWNKGKKGNGYVRFSRTFHSVLRSSTIHDIRHITLQWSASGNHIYNIYTGVDINFHGGYAHRNQVDRIVFGIPSQHKWKPIEQTPPDARWAPPDGENTIERDTFRYLHE